MVYKIRFNPKARKELRKVDKKTYITIRKAVDSLAANPRPPASRKLVGSPGYRLRVGNYRIIYIIEHKIVTVHIIKIGHRSKIYQ